MQKLISMTYAAVLAVIFGGVAALLDREAYVPATRLASHGVEVRGEAYNRFYSRCSPCAAARCRARTPTDVRYTDPNGGVHTTRLTIDARGTSSVRVLLDPADPANCAILEYGETYAVPPLVIFALTASAVLAFGFGGWFVYSAVMPERLPAIEEDLSSSNPTENEIS